MYSVNKRTLQTKVIPNLGREVRGGGLNFSIRCWWKVEAERLIYSFSLVLLQCLLLALYRIVLPVLILIHWGMGLFCLPFLARIRFTRKVFSADILHNSHLSCRSESSNKSL